MPLAYFGNAGMFLTVLGPPLRTIGKGTWRATLPSTADYVQQGYIKMPISALRAMLFQAYVVSLLKYLLHLIVCNLHNAVLAAYST